MRRHPKTAAGYAVDRPGRLARPGDGVVVQGHRIEVTDAAERRVRRLTVLPVEDAG